MIDRAEVTAKLEDAFRTCFFNPSIVITDASTVDDVDGWDSLSHVRPHAVRGAQHRRGACTRRDGPASINVGELIDYAMAKLERG